MIRLLNNTLNNRTITVPLYHMELTLSRIKELKRTWVSVSFIVAVLIPILSSILITDWSIYTDELSDFGTRPITAGLWPIYLVVTSVGLWFNGSSMISNKYVGLRAHTLHYLLNISSTALILTAIITPEFRLAHIIVATTFFLVYLLFVYLYGFWQIKYLSLREGAFSVVLSFLLLLSTLLLMPFSGLAIFEITYIVLIVFWNWAVRKKTPIIKIINLIHRKNK